jgi:hypothetical protein
MNEWQIADSEEDERNYTQPAAQTPLIVLLLPSSTLFVADPPEGRNGTRTGASLRQAAVAPAKNSSHASMWEVESGEDDGVRLMAESVEGLFEDFDHPRRPAHKYDADRTRRGKMLAQHFCGDPPDSL